MPARQTNKISGLTLMALARVVSDAVPWKNATRNSYTISKGIMAYVAYVAYVGDVLNQSYAENSRETFRRQVLHQFVQAGICM